MPSPHKTRRYIDTADELRATILAALKHPPAHAVPDLTTYRNALTPAQWATIANAITQDILENPLLRVTLSS